MGWIGPRRNRREVAGPAAGPALLAPKLTLIGAMPKPTSLGHEPKELGRPDGPHGWQDPVPATRRPSNFLGTGLGLMA